MRSQSGVETALFNLTQTVDFHGNTTQRDRAIGAIEAMIWMLDQPNHINDIWNGKHFPYERGMYHGIV